MITPIFMLVSWKKKHLTAVGGRVGFLKHPSPKNRQFIRFFNATTKNLKNRTQTATEARPSFEN